MDKNIIFLTTEAKETYLHIKTFCLAKTFKPKFPLKFFNIAAEFLSNQFKVALEVVTKIVKVLFDLF